ncbi:TrmH family RNA methyltransferase, partial [Mycoplasmopsis alligatoris]
LNLVDEIFVISGSYKNSFTNKNLTLITSELAKQILDATNPQSVFALCKIPQNKYKITGNKVVFLDNLQDPGNVGTIIRLSKSFDIDTLIVKNFDIYSPKCLRSTQGAIFNQNIILVNNNDLLKELQHSGFEIVTTVLNQESIELNNFNFNKKTVVIFGNEGSGIEKEIINNSNKKIYIPISFESLNVATCAAIVLNKWRNG